MKPKASPPQTVRLSDELDLISEGTDERAEFIEYYEAFESDESKR